MTETIHVKVTVDTDELREWAGKHADAGRHGVAHVLYKAAIDGESLSEQATREAAAELRAQIEADTLELVREWTSTDGRMHLTRRDVEDLRDQLADVISGRAS